MQRRKEEQIYNNYYKNENAKHSYGRLKRKMKDYDLNNLQNQNYLSNNKLYNDNLSKKNIHINKNNNNNNDNYNKKTKPIVRPSKSALPNKRICQHNYQNSDSLSKEKEYLLCQNCINSRLIEEKRLRNELNKKSIPGFFEDKYQNYSQNIIKEKVRQREKNIALSPIIKKITGKILFAC